MPPKDVATKKPPKAVGKYDYLLKPVTDLVDNFAIDILHEIEKFLEDQEKAQSEGDGYTRFNFPEASILIQATTQIYGRKVDYVCDQTYALLDTLKGTNTHSQGANARGARRKRGVALGALSFELEDYTKEIETLIEKTDSHDRDLKRILDDVRCMKEIERMQEKFTNEYVSKALPSHFNSEKLTDYPFLRSQQPILSAKKRPELLGRLADFEVKKAEMALEQQVAIVRDDYMKDVNEFTLPGSVYVPSNYLETNFGVPELDLPKHNDFCSRPNPYGPFKDVLTGRRIVAPPRWFVEQEATRMGVHRQVSREPLSGTTPLPTRMPLGARSSNFLEAPRELINSQVNTTVEPNFDKRGSTRLTNGVFAMTENQDSDGAEAMSFNGDDDDEKEPTRLLRNAVTVDPWDEDLDMVPNGHLTLDQYEKNDWRRCVVSQNSAKSATAEVLCKKIEAEKAKENTGPKRLMETYNYFQTTFYLRDRKKAVPTDWASSVLRSLITEKVKKNAQKAENERRAKEEDRRYQEMQRLKRNSRRRSAAIRLDDFEEPMRQTPDQRRTLPGVVNTDANVSMDLDIPDDDYDDANEFDVAPMPDIQPGTSELRFADISEDEIETILNLPDEQYLKRGVPLLQKLTKELSVKEMMAYKMVRVFEDVDDDTESSLQSRVDAWQHRVEPVLEEEETRKEFDIHLYGDQIIEQFEKPQEARDFTELVVGKKWYEISRYFFCPACSWPILTMSRC
ncbi:unnamed protein product [Caenorhabditis auriculariae]|uniref:Condensin-2 complex subunit H2 C-terminal domain-containing protein n=1 Tax=Caenorhabditis auriculariae TaxID=2777116 RepID=A0A8S1HK13_9PELO|nr:unnamed protein product [Caenorhabditis auriculariae]